MITRLQGLTRHQILQVGALTVDENLREIDEPLNLLCKPRNDVIPHPSAVLKNKIDLDECQKTWIN
jgi:exonuclease I